MDQATSQQLVMELRKRLPAMAAEKFLVRVLDMAGETGTVKGV